MKLKTKIASSVLAVLAGMMLVPQLSFAALNLNGSSDEYIQDSLNGRVYPFDGPVYFLDRYDYEFVAPGQTGFLQAGFFPIEYVQPTGTIEVESLTPDILSVDENGFWEAKQEGLASISVDWKFSDKTTRELQELQEQSTVPIPIPNTDGSKLDIYVTDCTSIFRLYNPNSGEHLYTASVEERKALVNVGWNHEGVRWLNSKDRSHPLYRLYNPNAGDHHYTMSEAEASELVRLGWQNEGVAMYAQEDAGTPIYRLYNPNAISGSHHFTALAQEYDELERVGWIKEGIAFHATSQSDVQLMYRHIGSSNENPTPVFEYEYE